MPDVVKPIAMVVILILFFPAVNGFTMLFWYNSIITWKEETEPGFTKPLLIILIYLITTICVIYDAGLIFSIFNAAFLLT